MMNRVVKIADTFKSQIGAITVDNLESYLQNKNWLVVWLVPEEKNKYLERLQLEDYAKWRDSFLYDSKDLKIVFVRDELKPEDKLLCLLHELGHIELGHKGEATPGQERQAAVFAEYCLKNEKPNRKKALVYACSAVFLLLLVASFFLSGDDRAVPVSLPDPTPTTPAVTAVPASPSPVITENPYIGDSEQTDIVIITSTGEKYHRPDCQYVRDRDKTSEVTIAQAEELGKEPCLVCRP